MLIVVTDIIPSITVARTVSTHVEVRKDIPIPTTAKTASMESSDAAPPNLTLLTRRR